MHDPHGGACPDAGRPGEDPGDAAAPPRRPRLTLDRLVTAALEVAVELGADRMTMKDVATHLDVGTMSLYHYVDDKAALLDQLVARLYGAVVLPDRAVPWRAQLGSITRQVHAGFVVVPGLDPLVSRREPPPEAISRVINATLAALHDAGLPPHDATLASLILLGFAAGRGAAAAAAEPAPADPLPVDTVFEYGLELLLDGLAGRVPPPVP